MKERLEKIYLAINTSAIILGIFITLFITKLPDFLKGLILGSTFIHFIWIIWYFSHEEKKPVISH